MLTRCDVVHESTRHGDLTLGLFAEGDTDRITDTISQERTDTDCALDTTVFAFTSLRHTQMQGIGGVA